VPHVFLPLPRSSFGAEDFSSVAVFLLALRCPCQGSGLRTARVSEFLPGFPAQELQEDIIVFVGKILFLS
jgi:hypothetical protein